MVFGKMAAICRDFKWLGFQISDPIQRSETFSTQPFFNNSKSRLVQISDPHNIYLVKIRFDLGYAISLSTAPTFVMKALVPVVCSKRGRCTLAVLVFLRLKLSS